MLGGLVTSMSVIIMIGSLSESRSDALKNGLVGVYMILLLVCGPLLAYTFLDFCANCISGLRTSTCTKFVMWLTTLAISALCLALICVILLII